MSCYHPLLGVPTGELTKNGKQKIRILHLEKEDTLESINRNGAFLIPCGHCIGCRLDYSRRWADRMMLELETMKKGIFLTLTYDDEHAHWTKVDEDTGEILYATVSKRDCQLFMKSLRKEFAKKDLKIRFYLASEYGPATLRPHYHAIIFGIGLSDIDDMQYFGRNDLGQPFFISEKIKEIWTRGNVYISDVSYQTCAYVARYVTKKLSGDMKKTYAERNVIPEFSLMSRKPGIGAKYLEDHPDCLDYADINISTPTGGRKIQMPKYYINKLELTDKEKFDKIKEQRRKFASDKMLLELQKTDLGLADYLKVKEENRKKKIKTLKRKDV